MKTTMKDLIFVVLLCLHGAAAVSHSLKNFYTVSSGVPNFPEFVLVGMLDDVQADHYDSNTKRMEPKQDWMNRITADDPQYWQRQTDHALGQQQVYKNNIDIVMQRFNQTGGVHILQWVDGCEWDDETGDINGFEQYGFDGEDFLAFDLKTETWVAPVQQAVISKHKLDNNKAKIARDKQYYTHECPEWLKKYLSYGKSSLQRTELPTVSLLQKTPSSPVSCHATGFYPNRAVMFWRKDGEDLHEGMDHGEILPNHDGSFQMSVDLKVSPEEDWKKYQCVFQLSGVKEDLLTELDKAVIRSNEVKAISLVAIIVAAVAVLVIITAITGGFFIYKKKKGKPVIITYQPRPFPNTQLQPLAPLLQPPAPLLQPPAPLLQPDSQDQPGAGRTEEAKDEEGSGASLLMENQDT